MDQMDSKKGKCPDNRTVPRSLVVHRPTPFVRIRRLPGPGLPLHVTFEHVIPTQMSLDFPGHTHPKKEIRVRTRTIP